MLHQESATHPLPGLRQQWRGVIFSMLVLLTQPVAAGNFAVSPIRVDFAQGNKNGAITVSNDGQDELRVKIGLYEWYQDWDGKDGFRESNDLIYFPRIATIAAGEKRLVRIGLRGTLPQPAEHSYRLFIEDIPENVAAQGSHLAIAVRFGVPLFVSPDKEEVHGEIEALRLDGGKLYVRVRNTGNVHFRISSVSAARDQVPIGEATGWYLLPGAARDHLIELPPEHCRAPGHFDVTVNSDRVTLKGALDITPSMCGG